MLSAQSRAAQSQAVQRRSGLTALALMIVGSVLGAGQALAQAPSNVYDYSRTSSFSYRSDGLLASETVEPGSPQACVVTSYGYDAAGNRVSSSTANCAGATGRAVFTARSSGSTYAASTASVGGTTVNIPAGLFATSASNALGHAEQREYDPRFGGVTKLTGPNGLITRWEYDDFGRKVKEIRSDGTSTVMLHCLVGDAIDATTRAASSSAGCASLVMGEKPAHALMLVHSEPRNSAGSKMGPFARVYSDAQGREIRSATEGYDAATQPGDTRAGVIVKDTVYSEHGSKVLETQPYFLARGSSLAIASGVVGVTRIDYDVLGRSEAIYTMDGQGSQPSVAFGGYGTTRAAVQRFVYKGLSTEITNDKSQLRLEEKNANGQLVRVTDAAGAQLAHQHDAFGNLIETKDALQNRIKIDYDTRGRKLALNDPDAGLSSYDYDALGQLVWQQNATQRAANTSTTLAYDTLGRLTQRVEPEYTSTWYYDKNAGNADCGKGRLCELRTSHGLTKTYAYDGQGRPISSRSSVSNGPQMATALGYDSGTGRLDTQTYPTGVRVKYQYTAQGFLQQLKLDTAAQLPGATLPVGTVLWQANVLNAWGKVETQSLQNGVNQTALFEASTGRLRTLYAVTGAGGAVVDQTYSWDSVGNLTRRVDSIGDAVAGAIIEDFEYDTALNRLSAYTVKAASVPAGQRRVELKYNALGMMLSKSDVGGYVYGAQGPGAVRPHALLQVKGASTTSYGFDANGNMVSASGGKYRSVSYTSFNLPDSQTGLQGSGSQYTWQYDESHARIRETRVSGAGTRTTWYLHPDNQGGLGFEREEAPNGLAFNRHYLSAGGQSLVLITNGALPALTAGQTAPAYVASVVAMKLEYWHKDHLGSTIATSDHAGNVTARMAYDPFGKRRYINGRYDDWGNIVIDWNGSGAGNDRGYTGHEHLDDVGIIHMNGRLYDPNLGVFLQADPFIQDMFELQNYNRYGYCYNSPLTCTDPSGYFLKKLLKKVAKVWRQEIWRSTVGRTVLAVAAAYFTAGAASNWAVSTLAQSATAATTGFSAATINAVAGIAGGLAGGFSSALVMSGGDVEQAFKGGLKGAITGGMFGAIGATFEAGTAASYAAHGVAGCVSSMMDGGKCGTGAISQMVSKAGTVEFGSGYIQSALIGGTVSAIGGGKFSNGALTGAFGYLLNHCSRNPAGCFGLSIRGALENASNPVRQLWTGFFGDPRAPASPEMTFQFGGGGQIGAWVQGGSFEAGLAVPSTMDDGCGYVQMCFAAGPQFVLSAGAATGVAAGLPQTGWQSSRGVSWFGGTGVLGAVQLTVNSDGQMSGNRGVVKGGVGGGAGTAYMEGIQGTAGMRR